MALEARHTIEARRRERHHGDFSTYSCDGEREQNTVPSSRRRWSGRFTDSAACCVHACGGVQPSRVTVPQGVRVSVGDVFVPWFVRSEPVWCRRLVVGGAWQLDVISESAIRTACAYTLLLTYTVPLLIPLPPSKDEREHQHESACESVVGKPSTTSVSL